MAGARGAMLALCSEEELEELKGRGAGGVGVDLFVCFSVFVCLFVCLSYCSVL